MEASYTNNHADVIERCLAGSRSAQNELYKQYSKAMLNISYRIANNRDDAEDILQESFISAFRNLNTYRGTASFGAWLKRIVVNKAINHIRKRSLALVPLEGSEHVIDEPIDDTDLVLKVAQIREAVQMLPDGYRVVFSLYLLEGYDHKEIAEILGISESTSKSQFNRSKKKLVELLRQENE